MSVYMQESKEWAKHNTNNNNNKMRTQQFQHFYNLFVGAKTEKVEKMSTITKKKKE